MATHLYRVGTLVTLQSGEGNLLPPARSYRIEAQMPPVGTSLQYRVRSEAETFSRVVPEYQVNRPDEPVRTAQVAATHPGEAD